MLRSVNRRAADVEAAAAISMSEANMKSSFKSNDLAGFADSMRFHAKLVQHARPLGRLRMAVVYPCDEVSLSAAMAAHAAGLIDPVLIGPSERLLTIADEAGVQLEGSA